MISNRVIIAENLEVHCGELHVCGETYQKSHDGDILAEILV